MTNTIPLWRSIERIVLYHTIQAACTLAVPVLTKQHDLHRELLQRLPELLESEPMFHEAMAEYAKSLREESTPCTRQGTGQSRKRSRRNLESLEKNLNPKTPNA